MNMPTCPDSIGTVTLQRTLRSTVHTGSPALKQVVCAFVDEVKSSGWPIERIIVHMKMLARDTAGVGELTPSRTTSDASEVNHVLEQAISWAIAHYYGERAR